MGLDLYSNCYKQVCEGEGVSLVTEISELDNLFENSPTGRQEDDRSQDWMLWRAAESKRKRLNQMAGHIRWTSDLRSITGLYPNGDEYTLDVSHQQIAQAGCDLRNYIEQNAVDLRERGIYHKYTYVLEVLRTIYRHGKGAYIV